ncbi:hypothetical protein AVEN_223970-1, partial [Araneus ventricosus]
AEEPSRKRSCRTLEQVYTQLYFTFVPVPPIKPVQAPLVDSRARRVIGWCCCCTVATDVFVCFAALQGATLDLEQ